jgi:putative restriction endonuclease
MDSDLMARLGPEHVRRLVWFEDHAGESSAFPDPLDDGLLLVCKAKGIYKPKDLTYALSIRINLEGPYKDGIPVPTPGGGWILAYHQENADPADRDKVFTNKGLMHCMSAKVPVGVLRELPASGHPRQYTVLGLATPVRWSSGYFLFSSLHPQAQTTSDQWDSLLKELRAAQEVDHRVRFIEA